MKNALPHVYYIRSKKFLHGDDNNKAAVQDVSSSKRFSDNYFNNWTDKWNGGTLPFLNYKLIFNRLFLEAMSFKVAVKFQLHFRMQYLGISVALTWNGLIVNSRPISKKIDFIFCISILKNPMSWYWIIFPSWKLRPFWRNTI